MTGAGETGSDGPLEADQQPLRPTTEQEEALDLDYNIAITAGAGTGKTTTLTLRYLKMLENDDSIGPENIVTITFTNDAANELQARVRAEVAGRLDAAPASEEYDYDRWREIKDDLEDGYIHTIHGFCARLLREYVVEAPVKPEFDTLDDADAGVLMQEVVRETVEDRWDEDPDIRRLARLWNRHTLETVLVGLLDSRPESTDWATRWEAASPEEYLDYIWATFYPVDQSTARELLNDNSVQTALNTLCTLHEEEYDIDSTDNGIEFMATVSKIVEETGILSGTADGRDWQRAFDALCDRLTTNDGDRYGRLHQYRGSRANWDGHREVQDQLETAATELLDGIRPEEHEFIGGLGTEWNSTHYVLSLARLYTSVLERYHATKADRNALDYHDLIQTCIEFLDENERIREQVQSQFEYIMVDEMQDTDPLQWKLVKLVSAGSADSYDARNVFLVGDEKQSIYRFRGADVTTFGAARAELETANPPEFETTKQLTGNFRTIGETREFLNALFDRLFEPMEEEYRPYEARPQSLGDERREGRDVTGEIEYLLVPDENVEPLHGSNYLQNSPRFGSSAEREALALACRLTTLLDDPPFVYDDDEEVVRPTRPEDITMLFRARTRLKAYERALDEFEIPYTVVSGTGFWDAPEITTLANLLSVLEEPSDDIALYGILRSPFFGFEDDRLARVIGDAESIWPALQAADGEVHEAVVLLAEWRRLAGIEGQLTDETAMPWGRLLSRIIDDTGFIASVGADERPRQAAVNINKFREQLRVWEEAGVKTIAELNTRIENRRQLETHSSEATIPEDTEGIQLRTIHSAKGLEFPIVVVPEMGTQFNFQADVDEFGKVYLDNLHVESDGTRVPVLGLKAPSGEDPYEHTDTLARATLKERVRMQERAEHKRELYVAMTRARDHLLLSGVHSVESTDDGSLTLPPPNDPDAAMSWRDWLQPILLEDDAGVSEQLLDALSRSNVARRTIESIEYDVSVPISGVTDWDESSISAPDYPVIDIPEPDVLEIPVSMTATTFATIIAPDARAMFTDEIPDAGSSSAGDGLQANQVGTIVHKLCERRPSRTEWRSTAERLAEGMGVTPTPTDLDRIEEHTERCLGFRDQLVDGVSPTTVHEELPVTARFPEGQISGDVDLMLVTPEKYHIVDFKTNDTTQRSVDELAEKYWPQLEVYAAACHQNHGQRSIETTLYFSDSDESRTKVHDTLSLEFLCDDLGDVLGTLRVSGGQAMDQPW